MSYVSRAPIGISKAIKKRYLCAVCARVHALFFARVKICSRAHAECHHIYKSRRLSMCSEQSCTSMWLVLLLVGLPAALGINRHLKLVEDWKSIDFNFPSERHRQDAIKTKQFVPGNAVPIDVDVHYKGCSKSTGEKLNRTNAFSCSERSRFKSLHHISPLSRWHSNHVRCALTAESERWIAAHRTVSKLQLASESNSTL